MGTRITRGRLVHSLWIGGAGVMLASCAPAAPQGAPSAVASETVGPAPTMTGASGRAIEALSARAKVKTSITTLGITLPFQLAIDKGYFGAAGLDVRST